MTFLKFPITKFSSKKFNNIKLLENPLPGLEIGIPLTIFSDFFTELHYGKYVLNNEILFLLFNLGYFAYGSDRLLDSKTYFSSSIINQKKYSIKKIKLYNYIEKNENFIMFSIFLSFSFIILELIGSKERYPFLLLLPSIIIYKEFKSQIGIFKSSYISLLWTLAAFILPCIILDENYQIFNYPQEYLPCFLTIMGSSNYADIQDIEEDSLNGINTLPIFLGKKNTEYFNSFLFLSSFFILLNVDNIFNRPLINSFFELQNLGFAIIPFSNNISSLV